MAVVFSRQLSIKETEVIFLAFGGMKGEVFMYRKVQELRLKHQHGRKIPHSFPRLPPNPQDIHICQLTTLAEPYQ